MSRRGRVKVERLHNNNLWDNSMDLDLCLETANQMLKVKFVIYVEKADISQIRSVVLLMQSLTNVERKAIMQ